MTGQLSLSIVEIIVLMLGAITLGFTIHFFVTSRRSFNTSIEESEGGKISKELSEWKLRYLNDIELRDSELCNIKKLLADAEENCDIFSIEADEMRRQNKKLLAEIEKSGRTTAASEKPDYVAQLRQAQSNLLEHNEKINQLLSQINIAKESEEEQQRLQKENEELAGQVEELTVRLEKKEKEANNTRQRVHLNAEMTSILDSANNEFKVLKEKIQKLENQVNFSKENNLEYENFKEGYYNISRDFEEQKLKHNIAMSENRQLKADVAEIEDKLREANFQRQQLHKKIAYLEELNNDMQDIADANKKLEGQLRRIGELESMLNVVAEERDELARRQVNE
jgi:chromosome segregation ATPase